MIGFIGLGVMGEPMCRHLVKKGGKRVIAYDVALEPCERLADHGVRIAGSVLEVAEKADVVFLSLPGAPEVKEVCVGAGSLLLKLRPGAYVVDLSTTSVAAARQMAARFTPRGIQFLDAPVARTRAAAEEGTLSVMVGGPTDAFQRMRPLLAHFASEVTHCGAVGAGQAMKLMNNMVLFQNVVALAEALAVVRKTGIDPKLALEVLGKGSADSFALRNHALKAMLPGEFPERAYSVEYALKDLGYALELAQQLELELSGARNARVLLESALAAGDGKKYFPVIARHVPGN